MLLKQAEIDLNGLFLNADPGFDSQNFRQACQAEGIFPNVKANSRNSTKQKMNLTKVVRIFLMNNYIKTVQ